VAGGDVVVGDAGEVVGTVVVVGARFGEEAPDLGRVRVFGLTGVVVGRVVVGRVVVGRAVVGRAVVGRAVVGRAESARDGVAGVVVGPRDVPEFDIFRSGLILAVAVVLVVVALLVFWVPVADVPARYRRRVDPCHLRRR
jgi:hypothetical protein